MIEMKKAKDQDTDRISNLPKELLEYILSFLSTRDAVRTSILSKRWEYLWTSIAVLDFEEGPANRKLFKAFVERVLVLRCSLDLQKFSLSCTVQTNSPHINSWIHAAIRRNVKELHLCLKGVKDSSLFPRCFFTCSSVTKLVMSFNWLSGIPKFIHFPYLRILVLKEVVFSDDNAAHQLFHGSPVLETLCIHECKWPSVSAITISSSSLQRLEIRENMENRNNARGSQFKLYCESLKSFLYDGALKNDHCLCNVPSLVEACVSIPQVGLGRQKDIAYRLNKLMIGILTATSLTLSSTIIEVEAYAKELFTHLPLFNSLTHFTLSGTLDLNYEVVNLLDKFPRLECLILSEGIIVRKAYFDSVLNVVSASLWSNLKRIIIGKYTGSEWEVNAVILLLKNASVLENLVIYCDKHLQQDMKKLKSMREELLKLRASSSCKAVLSFKRYGVCSVDNFEDPF